MATETTPLIDDEGQNGQLYDEDGYSIYSENTMKKEKLRAKVLYFTAVLVVLPLIWYVLFYLPNQVPPAVDSSLDIKKVDTLPVFLHPIEPRSKSKLESDELSIDDYKYVHGHEEIENNHGKKAVRRLIMIGDIHGSYRRLSKLIKKLKINHKKDHVLLLGDFISKGPDSEAVLNWAVANQVDCILGNHEIYILNRYAQFHSMKLPSFISNSSKGESDFSTKEFYDLDDEMKIAKKLKPEQASYLINCPLIYELGPVAHEGKKKGTFKDHSPLEGLAVHAGLQWNIDRLEDQDPEVVVTIRALLPPDYLVASDDNRIDGAVHWAKLWAEHQEVSPMPQKVYYGHSARYGLDQREYSVGLDSSCVTGGDLSAVSIWAEMEKGKVVYREKLYQVSCA